MFNRNISLWYQVSQHLRTRIAAGELPLGARLPTDRQLAEQYKVSIITIRQALATLVADKMISRHRGRGTFVTAKPSSCRELNLFGSADAVIDQQMSEETETEILERCEAIVPPELAAYFPDCKAVTLFRRLRREQGAPFSYALDYTVSEYARKVPDHLLRKYPMVKIFRDVIGIELRGIKLSVSATAATAEIAGHLGVEISSPVLRFVGVASDTAGRIIGLTNIYYRADRFRFTVDIDVAGPRPRHARGTARNWELSESAMLTPATASL
ncbi:MAG: GntR family transcriptional regulator [Candidatus Binataceae bacterium]|nr:GntR family transcriptional regulator [Candidatus Binataceae bacterium]